MFYRSTHEATRGLASILLCVAGCPDQSKNDSMKLLNDGNKALGQKQFDTAITSYENATEKWTDNHLA